MPVDSPRRPLDDASRQRPRQKQDKNTTPWPVHPTPDGAGRPPPQPKLPARLTVAPEPLPGGYGASGGGIAEGWRGTITHRIELSAAGILTRVKIVDPSFFNWPALPVAMRNTIVPDFPLANKSFNLSYAGNDL